MTCHSCGNNVEAFNRFCPKCGAPIQFQPPPSGVTPPYNYQAPLTGGPAVQPARQSSGCGKIILIVLIILAVLGAGIGAAIYFGYRYAEKSLKSSEAYVTAVNALKENSEVKEKLGEIKDTGFPIGAFTQDADGSGKAAFVMSVQGTKGSGKYQVALVRSNRVWHIEEGTVTTSTGDVIRIAEKRPTEEATNINAESDPPESVNVKGAVRGGLLNGKAISLPKPPYPQIAKAAKASGTVVVQVLVDEQGNVVAARALSGHPLLKAAAVAAARQAKFAPTTRAGKPVKVSGRLSYNFVLE